MAKNLVRYQQSGHLHFITFSCYRRRPYFRSAKGREIFERALETMRLRYHFYVLGYIVMPEHVHLLVSEPKKAILAKAIQAPQSCEARSGERACGLGLVELSSLSNGCAGNGGDRVELDGRPQRSCRCQHPGLRSETWGTHFGGNLMRIGRVDILQTHIRGTIKTWATRQL